MKLVKKTLAIVLTVFMIFTGLPITVLADESGPIDRAVESYEDLMDALGDETVSRIDINKDFALEDNVIIDREILLVSDNNSTITMDENDGGSPVIHSFKVVEGGDLTVGEGLGLEGVGPYAIVDVLGIVQVDEGGTFTLSGGGIEAKGYDGLPGLGIYVNGGDAVINKGLVYGSWGIVVNGGNLSLNGTGEISSDEVGIFVDSGNVTISDGGVITATGFMGVGVYVVSDGQVTIEGDTYIEAPYGEGVFIEGGIADIGGDARIEAPKGIYVYGGRANIGGRMEIRANYGVQVEGGIANISGQAIIYAGEIGIDVEDQYDEEDDWVEDGRANIGGDAEIYSDRGIRITDGGEVAIKGGKIEGERYGLYVGTDCRAEISGNADIESDEEGVRVETYGECTISGGRICGSIGISVDGGTLDISGGRIENKDGSDEGIFVKDGSAFITANEGLTITGSVYGRVWDEEGGYEIEVKKCLMTALPESFSMKTGESKTVTLSGVDEGVEFEIEPTVSPALGAVINENIITVAPKAAGDYDLSLTVTVGTAIVNLTLPIRVTSSSSGSSGGASGGAGSDNSTVTVNIDETEINLSDGINKTLILPPVLGVTAYTAVLPAASLAGSGAGSLILETDLGSITIPGNMLSGMELSGNVGISIGEGDKENLPDEVREALGDRPIVQLTLTVNGKQTDWNNENAPVTVSVPYTPTAAELANPENIVIWYIDGSGNLVSVPNGHYDPETGKVTFSTTHFSLYAVGYNPVTFKDVELGAWYGKAVAFIGARGISNGTGNEKFSPNSKLTRGEFIVLVMRAYGIQPDTDSKDNFADAGKAYYTNYLATAKRLSISNGVENNMYAPAKMITRQEMFVLLYNALNVIGELPEGNGNSLTIFTDGDRIAPWAQEPMKRLVEAGIVKGSGSKLNPARTTTRAEMAQVIYNLLMK